MAAGLTIYHQQLAEFEKAFLDVLAACIKEEHLQGVVWSDGVLPAARLDLQTALLEAHGPLGQAFEKPLFDDIFEVRHQKVIAEKHVRLLLQTRCHTQMVTAMIFCRHDAMGIACFTCTSCLSFGD